MTGPNVTGSNLTGSNLTPSNLTGSNPATPSNAGATSPLPPSNPRATSNALTASHRPCEATPQELSTWDDVTVEAPGGHVFQSRAWTEHTRRAGWQPRYLSFPDGARVVALLRPWPIVGGGSAYVARGPVPRTGGLSRAALLVGTAAALGHEGIDVVAADPEVPAEDAAYLATIQAAGFRSIEELQPSRHRISLPLEPGTDEDAAFGAIAKSTRQRIRAAERGLGVVRHDERAGADPGDGFVLPAEPAETAYDRFADLLSATGERRGFQFDRADFMTWWTAGHRAGHVLLLEARDADEPIAGLLLYRHGGRITTAHSADRAELRHQHPGALHLLRWRALQLAIREHCSELDLGGADLPGARRPPVEGEPMYGLYRHKMSFGGQWVEFAGAHERVIWPARYAAGRAAAAALRRAGAAIGHRAGDEA